ncbi:MAG: hypothetical protein FWG90_00390 [Oscillospiraceae bacterium]|nr:hypothetical protein [Oscillospiraceae bacterium]
MIKIWAVLIIAALVSFSAAGCSFEGGSVETAAAETLTETEQLTDEVTEEIIAVEKIENQSEFVYPADPLASADDLLNLVFGAKKKLYELGEVNDNMSLYLFGLIDIDFDGFPELFCYNSRGFIGLEACKVYSLKENNFCEYLTEYYAYNNLGYTDYMAKTEDKTSSFIIYNHVAYSTRIIIKDISKIEKQDGKYEYKQLFEGKWEKSKIQRDGTFTTSPRIFYINEEEVPFETFEPIFDEYISDLYPVTYLFENIYYTCNNVADSRKHRDDYDLLYGLYDEYLKSVKS